MKRITGNAQRDRRADSWYACGGDAYRLTPFYGELPDALWDLPFVSGCCDDEGNLYLLSRHQTHTIVQLDRDGCYVRSFGAGLLEMAHSIRMTPSGTFLCVDTARHRIREINRESAVLRDIGPGKPSDSGMQRDVLRRMQRSGHRVSPDIATQNDWGYLEALRTIRRAAPPFNRPTGVAVAPNGDLYVSDGYANAAVHRFSPEGALLKTWGGPGAEPGKFLVPHGIWVDRRSRVWVADREGNALHVFTPDGELLAYLGEGLYQPSDIWGHGDRVFVGERGGGVTVLDESLEVVGQMGYYTSPLRVHGLCGNPDGDLFLLPLYSYDYHYIMKLSKQK